MTTIYRLHSKSILFSLSIDSLIRHGHRYKDTHKSSFYIAAELYHRTFKKLTWNEIRSRESRVVLSALLGLETTTSRNWTDKKGGKRISFFSFSLRYTRRARLASDGIKSKWYFNRGSIPADLASKRLQFFGHCVTVKTIDGYIWKRAKNLGIEKRFPDVIWRGRVGWNLFLLSNLT